MYTLETVLVIVAHPDEEVLSCGSTLARVVGEHCAVHILLMHDGVTSRATDMGQVRVQRTIIHYGQR